MTRAEVGAAWPFFAVSDVARSIGFYGGALGFDTAFAEPQIDPFFAIMRRGGAQLFLKSQAGVPPLPNSQRHPALRWDAFLFVGDPDALAAEFASEGVAFSAPLADTHDGLRGFELHDPDGYVLFFGRPA